MATTSHITESMLERFFEARTEKEETRAVVRHLVSGCRRCSELAHHTVHARIPQSGPVPAEWEAQYDEVCDRVFARALEEERRVALERLQGWGQWASLQPLHPKTRAQRVQADSSFQTFGLFDRLLEASRLYVRTEPAEAVDIVRLAIRVAERLAGNQLEPALAADLCATGWATLGNTLRLASDFPGARGAFNQAWRILEEEGTNDPLRRAQIISLEASYISDIGEFETAAASLEEALQIYRRVGDRHLEGRVFLQMSTTIGHVDPERGLTYLRSAFPLIESAREPRLELCGQHDRAWFLTALGNPREALAVLEAARPLYRQFPDSYTQIRMHWLEGKISQSLQKLDEAESIYLQLWEELRVRDLNHELVLLSIDLAELLVQKGEAERAAEIVAQCHPILESWGLHTDALAAWLLFQRAITRRDCGTLFVRIREYYCRHWVRPGAFQLEG